MANEFKHKDPGSELTQAEFIASDGTGHIFDCQATGDIMYADSATVLKNLARGSTSQLLQIASCKPAWTSTPSIGSTSWANANHAHAASNSGGTLTTVGVLDAGSITSGFGTINTGASAITTTGAITGGSLVADNFTLNGTELDLSTGDFALDVAGDVEINADGGCINFKDASLALAAIVNTSCVGELRIHEACNYIGLKPPALSANQTWTWPATKGSCGEVLTCDGCGVLSWASASAAVTAVANGSDNRVSTFSSSTALNGEANLTFDGTILTMAAATSIQAGNGAVCNIGYAFKCDDNTGMFRVGADSVGLATNGAERLRISSGGEVSLFCGSLTPATGYGAGCPNAAAGDGPTVVGKGLVKVWGSSASTGGIQTGSHNAISVVKDDTGDYTVTMATDFPAGAYKAQATARVCGAAFVTTDGYGAGTFLVYTRCQAGNSADKVFNFQVTGIS